MRSTLKPILLAVGCSLLFPSSSALAGAKERADAERAAIERAAAQPHEPVARPTPPKRTVSKPAPARVRETDTRPIIANTPITEREERFGFTMVSLPSGRFTMGCQSSRDKECDNDEKPAHSVQISAFELGKTEVTQGQWKALMGSNPSSFKDCGDNCPVEQVSWDDVQTFIQKLNAQTGKTYRLPSESEWEYAYRAGTNSSFYTGNCINTSQANYDGNYDFNNCGAKTGIYKQKTVAVGSYPANPWGLYDMAGNVYEWVQDSYHSDYKGAPSDGSAWEGARADARVLRGGSWNNYPQGVRAAIRNSITSSGRNVGVGFRLARTLP